MTRLNIVCECYVDTRLVEILSESKKCNHQFNKGQVANALKGRLANVPAFGIVDEDRNKGSEPKYFTEFARIAGDHSLQLFKHSERQHFLVKIVPAAERWLIESAREANVNLREYGLSDNLKELISVTKQLSISHDKEFARMVKDLVRNQSPSALLLQKWLLRFCEGKPFLE